MLRFSSTFSDGVAGFPASAFAGGVVGFAGSRSLVLPPAFCSAVVSFFSSFACRFAVGCCSGADASFLSVLSSSPDLTSRSSFFRAFASRSSRGLHVAFTASAPPRVATAVRTRAFVRACSFLVVCSPLPLGRGSALAVRVAHSVGVPALVLYF